MDQQTPDNNNSDAKAKDDYAEAVKISEETIAARNLFHRWSLADIKILLVCLLCGVLYFCYSLTHLSNFKCDIMDGISVLLGIFEYTKGPLLYVLSVAVLNMFVSIANNYAAYVVTKRLKKRDFAGARKICNEARSLSILGIATRLLFVVVVLAVLFA